MSEKSAPRCRSARCCPRYLPQLLQGSFAIVVCYALFYITTVFALSYGVAQQHIPRTTFLAMLCVAAVFMAITSPISASLADRFGRKPVLLAASVLAALVGLRCPRCWPAAIVTDARVRLPVARRDGPHLRPARRAAARTVPATVAYTGASVAYSLGGILGASLAPYLAQTLLPGAG